MFFFSPAYFERFREALDSRLHLFVCLLEHRPVCAGLFVACNGILQFHPGGTLSEALQRAPMKLLIDEVRLWGTSQRMRIFHLGGGATPLLHFKKGFSDRTHELSVWRWVLFPEVYQRLCTRNPSGTSAKSSRLPTLIISRPIAAPPYLLSPAHEPCNRACLPVSAPSGE